jgi:hypothetical protein
VFESWASVAGAIDETAFSEYPRALTDETIATMCAYYRASFWIDRPDDEWDRRAAGASSRHSWS